VRLLHITPTYIPAYRYGGPIYSVHALCRNLASIGHEVHVLTTNVDGPGDSDVPLDRAVDLDGVQVHYSSSRWLRRLYWSAELSTQCATMVRDFDVLHLHSVFLFPTWTGARSAARAGVPYILSPRGMLDRTLINHRSRVIKRSWIRLIERRNLAGAAAIHLTSREERRALADLELALAPTVVIPNGVDIPAQFSPHTVSVEVRKLLADGFEILSFGRISWKKALDRLIGAMAHLAQARLLIAGPDEEGYTNKLRGLAKARGVADRVRFLARYVDGVDKEALFGAARIFVLPSLSENFGNVVAEAIIRGLPAVVTERVGAAELVKASGAGVVTPGGERDLAAALADLLHCSGRLATMRAAGATYARERLSWDSVARQFGELYLYLLSLSHHRRRNPRTRQSLSDILDTAH
jgi:glycosyltransferase involved in cell wall biosynthesis